MQYSIYPILKIVDFATILLNSFFGYLNRVLFVAIVSFTRIPGYYCLKKYHFQYLKDTIFENSTPFSTIRQNRINKYAKKRSESSQIPPAFIDLFLFT